MGIFNVAVSGLNAAQVGILTTSHNISNASTDGYNRQQIIQTTNTPMFTGAGFLGQGTSVETIRRVYSQQLSEQVLSASNGAAEMDSYLSQISQLDNLLADPDAGLSPALSSFFAAVQEMAAYPASLPARQAMLSASQALVSRFQAIDQRMAEIRTGVNAQITSEVTAINSYAQQIAEINQRIVLAQATGPNQPANDLLDQRDQLIADLNTKIRATTTTQSDGTYSVYIGNGQPLVIGTLPFSMQAMAAPNDPERMIVALQSPNGNSVFMPESMLTGGALGGLIAFRSETLDDAQNALGRIALTLATDVNAQHQLGLDLTGAPGGNYFVAASSLVRQPQANSTNTGTGVLSLAVTSITDVSTSDYRLSFDGANYTLLRLSDNTTTPYTLGTEVDGITLTLSGSPNAGDSFLIQPTRMGAANLALAITDPAAIAAALPPGGVADNRNALLLAALQTKSTMIGGTATYQSAYSTLVAQIGNKAREVEITGKAQQSLFEQAEATRAQLSGVNLDEEAANLLRYQQAYQAAAKVISIAGTLFDEILALGR
jgi:flagellar hook-associated protein 1